MKTISEILGGNKVTATHIKEHTIVTKSGTVAVVKEHEDSRQAHLASMPSAALHRALHLNPGEQVRHEGTTIDRHDFDHNSEKNQHPDTVEHFSVHNGMKSEKFHRSEIEKHLKSRDTERGNGTADDARDRTKARPLTADQRSALREHGYAAKGSTRTVASILSPPAPASSNQRVNEILGITQPEAVRAGAPVGNQNAEGPHTKKAAMYSKYAAKETASARALMTHEAHSAASDSHAGAAQAHRDAADENPANKNHHLDKAQEHDTASSFHKNESAKAAERHGLSASDATPEADAVTARATGDVVHCRAASDILGPVTASDKAWAQGREVSFMFMPSGQHTICAGFRNQSILLTVDIDPERDTPVVQASFQNLVSKYPKQKPFGCIEHEEKDASVWAKGFNPQADGIYLTAEPSALGENHVNGRIHRSWSPSFLTDADYTKATLKEYPSGKVYEFPAGVRGSETNPARITGVTFCVGTLTNNPAFKEINPVRAKEMAITMSEPIKAAQGAFAPGHPFYGNKYSQVATKASFQANVHKDAAHHHEAAEAHSKAARNHMTEAANHSSGSEERKALHEAAMYHMTESDKHSEKANDAASEHKIKEVKTKNEGYGFHGAAQESALREAHGDDYEPHKLSEDNKRGAGEQADNAFSRAANDLVAHGHFDDHKEAGEFLDSRMGRHVGDQIGHGGSVSEVGWLRSTVKDYKKAMSQEGGRAHWNAKAADASHTEAVRAATPQPDAVKAAWSDAAREAAKEAKSEKAAGYHRHEMGDDKKSPSHTAHYASANAYESGSKQMHKVAESVHRHARDYHLDAGNQEQAQEHEFHRAQHNAHASETATKVTATARPETRYMFMGRYNKNNQTVYR